MVEGTLTTNSSKQTTFHEVEISYSEKEILTKLISYSLKPHVVFSSLKVNLSALSQLEMSEKNSSNTFSYTLHDELKAWQPSQNLKTFTSQINRLIYIWLNAIEDGASTQSVLSLIKCFELNTLFSISHTSKLHCFIFALVAETTQQYQQLQINYARDFDTNTQLPNSNQISIALKNIIESADENQQICLFSIHFQLAKNNPFFSHAIISGLAKTITAVLQQNISIEHQLYFNDDSEFDLLIPKLSSDIQLNLVVAKLQRAFEQMIFVGNQSVLVTPFIGCAYHAKSSREVYDIHENAKLALESALFKQQTLVVYSEVLKHQLSTQNDLENKVIEAFNSDNLTLFFQPLVNLKDSSCAGAELLLRWSENTGQNVHPGLTVEILNKVGKGKLFTRWLINSACRYLAELTYEHKLDLYLTINLRAEDLYDSELPHLLLQALALWKVDAKNIVLEITENGILEHNETTTSIINELAKNGFRLALDDFGTGFSSLSRLRTMPIDLIKIDQSFVRDITRSKENFEIVKSIAMLANSLGKEVLVEGVEEKASLDLIKKMKIHKCQGYYFSKPLPFKNFVLWAKAHNPKLI